MQPRTWLGDSHWCWRAGHSKSVFKEKCDSLGISPWVFLPFPVISGLQQLSHCWLWRAEKVQEGNYQVLVSLMTSGESQSWSFAHGMS